MFRASPSIFGLLVFTIALPRSVVAQNTIVPDGTLGSESSIVQPLFDRAAFDGITGGSIRESSLFHSFSQFNVGDGLNAYFLTNPNIRNIFVRVTGSEPSNILGRMGTRNGQVGSLSPSSASLFFLNPNGIVFGPQGQLDLAGSFVATTADAFLFEPNVRFSASGQEPAPILAINTPIGLQFGAQVGDIRLDRGVIGIGNPNKLPNQLLGIFGGNITGLDSSFVGIDTQVILGAIGENQTVQLRQTDTDWQVDYGVATRFKNIQLRQESTFVAASTQGNSNGQASLKINANLIEVLDGSLVGTLMTGSGKAGNVDIQARSLIIRGEVAAGNRGSGVSSSLTQNGSGITGDINIRVNNLEISDGGSIFLSSLSPSGATGTIKIEADQVTVAGVANSRVLTGIFNRPLTNASELSDRQPTGIFITAKNLLVDRGAQITTESFLDGNSQDIILDITDKITVRGQFALGGVGIVQSGISTSKLSGLGNAGNIGIRTNRLEVLEGGSIQTELSNLRDERTSFQGKAGNITIDAQQSILVDGYGAQPTFSNIQFYQNSSISTVLSGAAIGSGGDINIKTSDLKIQRGGAIESRNITSTGNAGNINILVAGDITISGEGNPAEPEGFRDLSTISSRADSTRSGNAGVINLVANSLNIAQGGRIESRTTGQGHAGDISIRVIENLNLDGISSGGRVSQIASSSVSNTPQNRETYINNLRAAGITDARFVLPETAIGDGGNLLIIANNLNLSNEAEITASSDGQGNAGSIQIDLRDRLTANSGIIQTNSVNTTGGDITANARSMRFLGNSKVQTQVATGAGSGGDINLTADTILLLDRSDVLAFAKDGKGGDIRFNSLAFFAENYRPRFVTDPQTLLNNTEVDINASGAVSGLISFPDSSYVQNSLNPLNQNVIDPNQLIAKTCIRRDRNTQGSLYVLGAGGLPDRPGDLRATQYPTGEVRDLSPPVATKPWQKGDPIVEPQGAYQLSNGEWILSQECGV